jgi:hypothetical protein
MLYRCIANSLTGDAASTFSVDIAENKLKMDGPTLFHKLVTSLHNTSIQHVSQARKALQLLNAKTFSYNISKLHEYVRQQMHCIRATASTIKVDNRELTMYLMDSYQRIRLPKEWVSTIDYMENANRLSDVPPDPTEIMRVAEKRYKELVDRDLWKPSDKDNEDMIAMLASMRHQPAASSNHTNRPPARHDKDKTNRSRREVVLPPFKDEAGKLGDSRVHNDQTYYWCSHRHYNGHWVTHKPEHCKARQQRDNTASQASAKPSLAVTVDQLKSFQGILDYCNLEDPDDLAKTIASFQATFFA